MKRNKKTKTTELPNNVLLNQIDFYEEKINKLALEKKIAHDEYLKICDKLSIIMEIKGSFDYIKKLREANENLQHKN